MSDLDTTELPVRRTRAAAATGDTVTVGCKLPNGLTLRVFDWHSYEEPNSGGKMRKIARQRVEAGEHTLNGNVFSMEALQSGDITHRVAGGFGITTGVPRDFWDLWMEQNKGTQIVREGLVFAYESEQGAVSKAREYEGLRSGLEPIDPDRPPRDVRNVKRGTMNNDDVDNL